jgi:hypothetical protein
MLIAIFSCVLQGSTLLHVGTVFERSCKYVFSFQSYIRTEHHEDRHFLYFSLRNNKTEGEAGRAAEKQNERKQKEKWHRPSAHTTKNAFSVSFIM